VHEGKRRQAPGSEERSSQSIPSSRRGPASRNEGRSDERGPGQLGRGTSQQQADGQGLQLLSTEVPHGEAPEHFGCHRPRARRDRDEQAQPESDRAQCGEPRHPDASRRPWLHQEQHGLRCPEQREVVMGQRAYRGERREG